MAGIGSVEPTGAAHTLNSAALQVQLHHGLLTLAQVAHIVRVAQVVLKLPYLEVLPTGARVRREGDWWRYHHPAIQRRPAVGYPRSILALPLSLFVSLTTYRFENPMHWANLGCACPIFDPPPRTNRYSCARAGGILPPDS